MKNLSLILNLDVKVRDCEGADFVFFRGKCPKSNDFIDSDEEVFFIKEKYLYRLNLAKGTTKVISLSDVYDSGASQILSITYNEITEEFYSFHRDGEVFSFRVSSDGSTATGQISQTIEGGITAVVWSPDEEFGALVNSKNELFILTANCDVMNYWDLQDDTEGEHQFINVGWGKKETQFQGSAGKAAAYAKPEQVNADEVKDEKSVRVSWRGDSSIFAVSYWDTRDNKRKIKIFSREGLLQCCGEDIAGLEEPLCWRPQGNITMVQRLPNKHVIAFMEKNGLKHYDFPLPDGLTVVDLYWNQDSQILCSYCIEAKTESPLLLMWTTKNYHWYLKYTYTCPSPPVSVMWDCKRENRLKIAYNNGNVNVLEFIWSVDHSGYSSSDDKSYISVIDNDTLLVSQFSAAVVPPPMSMWSLKFDDPVLQICYPLQASIYSLAAICGEHIGLITKDADNELAIKKRLKIDADGINLKHSYSWLWIEEQTFACCTPNADLQTDLLLMHTIDDQLNLKQVFNL
ncbi:Hypothetical protein NTJ_00514 [Nesidiocoris tenuis]|uniref:Elongator complex protein 1 n=1 Tax=Nesidiocoris tenuis TaxID=355587 RepID=A0ABN7A8Z8_9HEMI|nr:Hypothetical protein NTJ_00514 [Nesidiocoris tenuis]